MMRNKLLVIMILLAGTSAIVSQDPITDADYTFAKAVEGSKAPQKILDDLCLLNVTYYSTDSKLHRGQLVIAKDLKSDVEKIFEVILKEKFPVAKCIPIVKYKWSDAASMADNNTSAFCYRTVSGSKSLSLHAKGRAIDINPKFNPCIEKGVISPKGAKYKVANPGTFSHTSAIYKKFISLGWKWGGNFKSLKDYHHFFKKDSK